MAPKRARDGHFVFEEYPDFKPNLSPKEIFALGSFGGTYWRPIDSVFYKTKLRNKHLNYPASWWRGIPESHLTSPWDKYDPAKNKYNVTVGTTLEYWECKGWIKKSHPYGWVHWYCDFFLGKRCDDDARQVARWKKLAGQHGRFMRFLVTQIEKKKADWRDETVSPKIRQTLQHWGYVLTKKDYEYELERKPRG